MPFWTSGAFCGGRWSIGTRSQKIPAARLSGVALASGFFPVEQSLITPPPPPCYTRAHPLFSDLWGWATAQGSHAELGGGRRRARGRGEGAAAGTGQGASGLIIHLGAVNLDRRDTAW